MWLPQVTDLGMRTRTHIVVVVVIVVIVVISNSYRVGISIIGGRGSQIDCNLLLI